MSPDHSPLLSELTCARGQADSLAAAAAAYALRRARCRTAAAVVVLLCATGAAVHFFPSVPLPKPPPGIAEVAHAEPAGLTPDQLLDSFGGQPVGLVIWPDGRQQLLAILPPPSPE